MTPIRCLGCGHQFPEPVFLPRWDGSPKLVVCFACEPPTTWCEACAAKHPPHEETPIATEGRLCT